MVSEVPDGIVPPPVVEYGVPKSLLEEPPVLGYTAFEVTVYVLGLACVMFSMPLSQVWYVVPTWTPYAGLALVLGTVYVSQWINRRTHRGLLTLAKQHDYLLCVHCGYPTPGSLPTGRCPECGEAFDRDHARALWLNAERNRQK
jgi:hypothetical protein